MKSIGKKEVINRQSAEFIKQGEEGKFLKLVPDTFIIKMKNGGQGYAIRHLNGKDMVLIDTVGEGAEAGIKFLQEEGYKIKAILVTHKDALRSAYAPLKKISEDAGGAPIFSHPINNSDSSYEVKDITGKHEIFKHFALTVQDFAAASGETAVIHSEINEGMIFPGNAAVGSSYESEEEKVERPDTGSENKNFSLAENWRSYMNDFAYFFPYKGKPKFDLSDGEQKDIVLKLGNTSYPGGGNPNL